MISIVIFEMKLEQSILNEISHGPVFATKQNYICSSAISNKITYFQFLHLIKKKGEVFAKAYIKGCSLTVVRRWHFR